MPTITFQVNLATINEMTDKPPYNHLTDGANFANSRVAYFPSWLSEDNRELKHGSQFTVSGQEAMYLKNNFTTGQFAFLTIVSQTSP